MRFSVSVAGRLHDTGCCKTRTRGPRRLVNTQGSLSPSSGAMRPNKEGVRQKHLPYMNKDSWTTSDTKRKPIEGGSKDR